MFTLQNECILSVIRRPQFLNIKPNTVTDIEEGVTLMCVQCKERFTTAWDLMVHVQAAHMLNVYELSSKVTEDRLSSPQPNANNGQQRQPPEQIKVTSLLTFIYFVLLMKLCKSSWQGSKN